MNRARDLPPPRVRHNLRPSHLRLLPPRRIDWPAQALTILRRDRHPSTVPASRRASLHHRDRVRAINDGVSAFGSEARTAATDRRPECQCINTDTDIVADNQLAAVVVVAAIVAVVAIGTVRADRSGCPHCRSTIASAAIPATITGITGDWATGATCYRTARTTGYGSPCYRM